MASEQDSAPNGNDEFLARRKMLILYGSETGNSEDAAGDIERMARRLHFQTLLEEMNETELGNLLQYTLVIFVVSTTGQGDLPKNARGFWKSLLRKRLPPNCLRSVNFTTFGLGDSSYFQYNWAARKLHKRLGQLGAVEFVPRGEADERHEDGIDGTFLPWCRTLQTYLEKEYPLPPGLSPIPPDVQLAPKFTIELAEATPAMDHVDEAMPDYDAARAGGASQIGNTDEAGSAAEPQIIATRSKTVAELRAEFDIDNQGRQLDREAALFSHVDDSPHRLTVLKYEHEIEDRMNYYHIGARLSEGSAKAWPGGIDILDRPNVLRDAPTKYSLDDSAKNPDVCPPASLLPIPDAWYGVVDDNIRLTPYAHWQDVRHLIIRLFPKEDDEGNLESLIYEPGDVAVIYPKNFLQDVQALIDLMDWGEVADKPFIHQCKSADILYNTPKNCYPLSNSTLRQLLTHNYDITCIPRRSFFEEIAHYTEDPTHKERLREFANPGLSDEFWDYTSRPRRSILEVLQDFPSVRIPYQHVPSIFPVIRGREYSIASSGLLATDPDAPGDTLIELVVALVKYKTVLRKTRQGLCSRYIASLNPGTPISVTVQMNRIPDVNNPRKPLIAIAPGTGIAPIRSLIFERTGRANNAGISEVGETVLFYGGRSRNADFYFEEEWTDLGIEVITAFSRDQPHKIYVQDRILENYVRVCELIRKGASICLCGSSGKMPEAVRLALCDCLVKGELATDREHAKQLLHHKDIVFWEEVW
ncbi:riboflavin synthase domain-like protein [Xylariaceae sp. FL1651]|nr:riboflavin synthase domain-like protein [Xylariaceae sp. FL1651]